MTINYKTAFPCFRYQTKDNFTLYKRDFITLYIDLLKVIVNAEHSTGIYLSSSPTNGLESMKEGWVAQNPYDTIYGDGKLLYSILCWQWCPQNMRRIKSCLRK